MNIQNSPKQIALTNDQINGIKNKYATMVPAKDVQNTPIAAPEVPAGLPQAEVQFTNPSVAPVAPQMEANIFDVSPVATPTPEVTQAVPENPTENIFNTPIEPVQEAAPVNNNPTNADIIANENIFNTFNNENVNQEVAPVSTGNIFEQTSVAPNPMPIEPPIQTQLNTDASFEDLLNHYTEMQKVVVNLYAMMETFGAKLETYIKNNKNQDQNLVNQTRL